MAATVVVRRGSRKPSARCAELMERLRSPFVSPPAHNAPTAQVVASLGSRGPLSRWRPAAAISNAQRATNCVCRARWPALRAPWRHLTATAFLPLPRRPCLSVTSIIASLYKAGQPACDHITHAISPHISTSYRAPCHRHGRQWPWRHARRRRAHRRARPCRLPSWNRPSG